MAVPAHLGRLRRLMKLVRSAALKRQERAGHARRLAHFGGLPRAAAAGAAGPRAHRPRHGQPWYEKYRELEAPATAAARPRARRLEGRAAPSARRHFPGTGSGWLALDELGSLSHCFPPLDFFLSGGHEALFQEKALPCGLLPSQVSDLLERDITPEDYDMLLKLDEGIQRPTASKDSVDALPTAEGVRLAGESCSICLLPFQQRDSVKVLQCDHMFHRDCISKWLEQHSCLCPLCGRPAVGPTSAAPALAAEAGSEGIPCC